MKSPLAADAFARLLDRLDPDRSRAGERYEDLRRTLTRFFEWRGAPFPDEHADETFDRVARRLAEGVHIHNIGGYCYEVARLIFLETLKSPHLKNGALGLTSVPAPVEQAYDHEHEARLSCLDSCLDALPADNRELIIAYYREPNRDRIVARRALADRLGIRAEALANRAQRVRDKLERCVGNCLRAKSPT